MATNAPTKPVTYPSSDRRPTAETELHQMAMSDLIDRLRWRYAGVPGAHATGNLLVY